MLGKDHETVPEESFSLVLGGPLYQLYLRSRLLAPPVGLVERRIVAAILVAWVPLLILTVVAGSAAGGAKVPFLLDLDAHIRLLLALPMLIAAEPFVHSRMRLLVRQFIERGVISEGDRGRFEQIITTTMRLRDSVAIEIALLLSSIILGYWIWRQDISLHMDTWYVAADHAGTEYLTAAGWWYAFVSLNVFRFVLYRWYFRVIVWGIFLWRVSRLPLRLNPLHPDRAGGIGFVGNSIPAFVPVLLVHTVMLAGGIAGHILYEGMQLPAFRLEIAAVMVLLMGVVLLPLSFFVPHLIDARRSGLREYGLLSMEYVDGFRAKWMRGTRPEGEQLVGSSDIQSLADLANAYEVVQQIRVIPVSQRAVLGLAIVTALPLLPLTLTMIPIEQLIDRLLGRLF